MLTVSARALTKAVLLAWAIIQANLADRTVRRSAEITTLIQGLSTNDIGSIVLGVGDNAVTLKLFSRGFVAADKDNYPAQTEQINDLIVSCVDIPTMELVTRFMARL